MDDAVENGIGQGRVLNSGMPLINGKLGGEETGGAPIAVIQEVQELPGVIRRQGISQPFVQDD